MLHKAAYTQSIQANSLAGKTQLIPDRMQTYLRFFDLEELSNKLQVAGITNLDYCSYVWYNAGYNEIDAGNEQRKKELHKAIVAVLSVKEYMIFTYII